MYNKIMDFLGRFLGTTPVKTKHIFPDEPVVEPKIEEVKVPVAKVNTTPAPKVDMSKMTKAQVVALAKEKGVALNMKMKKNEMLAALDEN